MDLHENWPEIRHLFARSFFASIASIDAEGRPHVTPIGSLLLHKEPGHAFYFEAFTTALPRHLDSDAQLCAMAVDTRLSLWGPALIRGAFPSAPGIRLAGTATKRRPATQREMELFQRRVRGTQWTRGYKLLFKQMAHGREVRFERALPLRLGRMWPPRQAATA